MTDTQTPLLPTIVELIGHTSPETAWTVQDYPYGFRLRTEIRYWVETKNGHGQRVVSQTRNPKKAGNPWNKPKASTYYAVCVLYLDGATGYVEHSACSEYTSEEKLRAFVERFPLTCGQERNRKEIDVLIARDRAMNRVTWTITSGTGEPRQTHQEQAEIMHKLTCIELGKLRAEGGE